MAFKRPGVRSPSAPPGNTKGSVQDAAFFWCARCRAASVTKKETPVEGASGGFFLLLRTRFGTGERIRAPDFGDAVCRCFSQFIDVLAPVFPGRLGGFRADFRHVSSSFCGSRCFKGCFCAVCRRTASTYRFQSSSLIRLFPVFFPVCAIRCFPLIATARIVLLSGFLSIRSPFSTRLRAGRIPARKRMSRR